MGDGNPEGNKSTPVAGPHFIDQWHVLQFELLQDEMNVTGRRLHALNMARPIRSLDGYPNASMPTSPNITTTPGRPSPRVWAGVLLSPLCRSIVCSMLQNGGIHVAQAISMPASGGYGPPTGLRIHGSKHKLRIRSANALTGDIQRAPHELILPKHVVILTPPVLHPRRVVFCCWSECSRGFNAWGCSSGLFPTTPG